MSWVKNFFFNKMGAKPLPYIVSLDTAVYLRTKKMWAFTLFDDLWPSPQGWSWLWDWKPGSQVAPDICPHAWAWAPVSNQHVPFLLPSSQASHYPSLHSSMCRSMWDPPPNFQFCLVSIPAAARKQQVCVGAFKSSVLLPPIICHPLAVTT